MYRGGSRSCSKFGHVRDQPLLKVHYEDDFGKHSIFWPPVGRDDLCCWLFGEGWLPPLTSLNKLTSTQRFQGVGFRVQGLVALGLGFRFKCVGFGWGLELTWNCIDFRPLQVDCPSTSSISLYKLTFPDRINFCKWRPMARGRSISSSRW